MKLIALVYKTKHNNIFLLALYYITNVLNTIKALKSRLEKHFVGKYFLIFLSDITNINGIESMYIRNFV